MLDEACRLILGEILVSPSAPGGKVEYRRTLLVSFFFRFYLEVLQGLKNMVNNRDPNVWVERLSLWFIFPNWEDNSNNQVFKPHMHHDMGSCSVDKPQS